MSGEKKVLFFGRRNCEFTPLIYERLVSSKAAVTVHLSRQRGEPLPDEVLNWSGDYIFSFRSLALLPMDVIASASLGAINFHPGPPEYPGSGCTNFALYEESKVFGVTAHLMEDLVDSGPILEVRRFKIAPDDNINSLTKAVHTHLCSLAMEAIPEALANDDWVREHVEIAKKDFKWSGTRRRISAVNEMRRITPSMPRAELERRIRSFHHADFPLFVEMAGLIFFLPPYKTSDTH